MVALRNKKGGLKVRPLILLCDGRPGEWRPRSLEDVGRLICFSSFFHSLDSHIILSGFGA
jgi:hypothetical protein